jgi:prolipoprotein diacylglyceryltransferase
MNNVYLTFWVVGGVAGAIAGILVLWSRRAFTWVTFVGGVLAVVGLVVGAKLQYRIEHLAPADALRISPFELFEPGVRLPLGILLGGVLAGLWSLALRAPWRDLGDALAVATTVMIPIGRMGCWSNRCCMGTVCGHWALPVCLRFPPGTESYNQQLRDNLIALSDPLSLPAHPLPLYFAAGSLGILLVLLWMLRRPAAPGMMLAAACVLGSAGKLALETLRAEPRPPGLMFAIPATVLAVTSGLLVLAFLRRVTSARAARARLAAGKGALAGGLAAMLALAGLASPARGAGGPGAGAGPPSAGAMEALVAYARDPVRNRRGLRRLERGGTEGLPPVLLIAMADARLRSGQRRAAAGLFEQILAREPGEPWASWARLGLGWNALVAGDLDGARPHLGAIAASGGRPGGFAMLLVALIDASDGRPVAIESLRLLAADPARPPPLREAARLGSAYARYWAGDFAGAQAAFEMLARERPASRLADDALYGAAWSRVRTGDRDGGRTALAALAGDRPVRGRSVSEAIVNLDPRALVRAGFERYRRGPLRPPEDQVTELLDGDGRRIAREALRRLDEAPRMASTSLRRGIGASSVIDAAGGRAAGESGVVAASAAPGSGAAPAGTGRVSPGGRGGSRLALGVAALAVLLAGYVLSRWRRTTRPQHGPGRW